MNNDLDDSIAEIRALMESHLRVRGQDLPTQMRRAGRLLPRWVRIELRYLADSEALSRNPKLARMVNPARVAQARERVTGYLAAIDPNARFKDRALEIGGSIGLGLFVILLGFVVLAAQTGLV